MQPAQDVKLAILVVLYYPKPADLELLDELCQAEIPSYLIDNTPHDEQALTESSAPTYAGFTLLHQGENIGLSRAYDQGFNQARNDGFSHMLVFDQDTRITPKTLTFIIEKLIAKPDAGMMNFSQKNQELAGQCDAQLLTINSATAFNLACHDTVQGFNQRYFVDCVDYDYCWRCLRAGKGVFQVKGTPGLDHLSGQPGRAVQIFGKTLYARSYGPRRNAEILRGHLYLLGAGVVHCQRKWNWAILRSLALFFIGRTITFVTFFRTGKS